MELGLYQHYKGNFYEVVDIAKDSDSQEEMVVYCGMYGKFETWVKSKKRFEEMLVVDGHKVPHFRFIETLEEGSEGLLCVLNNEKDLKEVVMLLTEDGVEHEVRREEIKPKPAHLESNLFLKVFVGDEDFELALDLIHGSHNE